MRIFKTLVFALSALTFNSQAGLITDYSLDSETNIVTDKGNNLEWLQWSVTRGQSITDALAHYASDGWGLASGSQIAGLFNTFDLSYGNFTWQDGQSNTYYSPEDGITESKDDRELIFVSLFGDTVNLIGLQASGALFGFNDNDNTYNWAQVGDDAQFSVFGQLVDGLYIEGESRLQFNFSNIANFQSSLGVALVRSSDLNAVPEPSALALFALALAGILIRLRNAKQPSIIS